MLDQNKRRLDVSINDIRAYNAEYANGLLESPMEFLPPFDKALRDIVSTLSNPLKGGLQEPVYVGLYGSFGENQVKASELNSLYIGRLICIEGIVSKCILNVYS